MQKCYWLQLQAEGLCSTSVEASGLSTFGTDFIAIRENFAYVSRGALRYASIQ